MGTTYTGNMRFVYAGPGDGTAGALSKSGIALFVNGTKKDSNLYRLSVNGRDITQHDFRDHEGEDLVFRDATVETGIGKATSKMVSVATVTDYDEMNWEPN